jgi:hypothetical protein
MTNANVQVHIRSEQAQRTRNEGALIADVEGEFDMECTAVPKGGEDLDLVFPIYYTDEASPECRRFSAGIDGKPAEDVKTTTWSLTTARTKQVHTLWGYTWRLPGLKGGQKRQIAVRYSLVLPRVDGKARFIYVLRTGAGWNGPIGREVVNVTAEKGIRMEVLTPTALEPEQKTDTSLSWSIVNAKPWEDIRLVIVPDAKP